MEPERPEELRNSEAGDECLESTATPAAEEAAEWKWLPMGKAGYICMGVILPTICFLFASSGFLAEVDWQSGRLTDYCSLLLSMESCLPFYPFLLFPMICMTLMVIRPERYSQLFIVRLGIYTGPVLAIHYFVLLGLAVSDPPDYEWLIGCPLLALLLWACAYLLSWVNWWEYSHDNPPIILFILRIFAILILLFACIPPYCFLTPLVCSTPWAIIAYSMMTWRLLRRNGREPWQFSLAQLFAFVTWLAAYLSAWRLSVNLMLVEYAKLPTTPPEDCYVCTAAARGHRRFVGSQVICGDTGNVFLINNQTRYLKAAEIVLAGTCPRLHCLTRAVYNRVGPPAAKLLSHPLAADAAYLAMKPAEWTARVFLAVALPQASQMARLFYRECRK